jgi:small subunit ribosomal protein S7
MKKDLILLLIVKCFKGCLIKKGNRARGVKIFDETMFYIQQRIPENNPLEILYETLLLFKPSVNIWTKKRGGSSYKLPFLINEERAFKIAIHWLIKEARLRKERSITERLVMR